VLVPGKGALTGVDFVLEPGAAISGCALDTTGRRVPDARLILRGTDRSQPGSSATTDAEGRFMMEDLEAGTYIFSVFDPVCRASVPSPTPRVTVTAGEQLTGVEVIFPARPRGSIEGTARDHSGAGIPRRMGASA